MKVLLFLASFLFFAHAFSILDKDVEEWKAYKMEYKKSYSEEEDKFRMKVFMDNKRKIEKHNARYEKGEVTFTMGLNEFSDMLHSEFVKIYNAYNGAERSHMRNTIKKTLVSTYIPPNNVKLPDEVNWVEKGAVTPIKNQGQCGSCWAFSSTGAIEGQHFLKTGKLVSLSEQQLIDCSTNFGNLGCNGGLQTFAFSYVFSNQGINTEESYPYTAKDGKCSYNPNNIGARIAGFAEIPPGNESLMQLTTAILGPVSVSMDANHESFMHYKGGIFSEPECSQIRLDHAVLVVGYGIDKNTNQKYWLVKNSWGESWGEKGYFKITRDANNTCGIATEGTIPMMKPGGDYLK